MDNLPKCDIIRNDKKKHDKTTKKDQTKSQNKSRAFKKIKIRAVDVYGWTVNHPPKNIKTRKIETVLTGKTLQNYKNATKTKPPNQPTPQYKNSTSQHPKAKKPTETEQKPTPQKLKPSPNQKTTKNHHTTKTASDKKPTSQKISHPKINSPNKKQPPKINTPPAQQTRHIHKQKTIYYILSNHLKTLASELLQKPCIYSISSFLL